MEDTGTSSAGHGGERFDGRLGGLSVADLKLGYQNRLQLLRSRRSATAPTLTDEDKFAMLLDMCTGDAWHVLQDKFKTRLEKNVASREETETKNRDMEKKLADKWHKAAEPDGAEPGPVSSWPRLVPEGDPELMANAWTFLQTTYPEQTAHSLSAYLDFKYVPGRTTAATFHVLRELCRKNGKEVTGREITEKALKSLRPEVRRALESDVLKWEVSKCTLTNLEDDARKVEDALHTRDLERAPQTLVKSLTAKVQDLSVSRPHPRQAEDSRPRRDRSPRSREDRRGRGKGKAKQAYAATAATARQGSFNGNCYNCGKAGHMKSECKEKPKGGGGPGRKPGACCGHCKKRDSHTEDECWEKHPDKRPEKWKQPRPGGPARPAYAAEEVSGWQGEDNPGAPGYDPLTAWTASLQGQAPGLDVMAVGAPEDLPELRPSTQAQRETEPAARARGEAERLSAKAREDRLRRGGPPPAFRPKGDRAPPEEGAAGAAPPAPRAATEDAEQLTSGPAQSLPPSFGEYPVTDPRYQGSEDIEHVGMQPHLLEEPKVGPHREVRVHRPEPFEAVPAPVTYAWVGACTVLPMVVTQGQPLRCRGGAGPPDPRAGDAEEDEPDESEEEGDDGTAAAAEAAVAAEDVKEEEPIRAPTEEEARTAVIPPKYRYYPPAQLPFQRGKKMLDNHIALMERNFRKNPRDPYLPEHRTPGWIDTPRWSQFKFPEIEAYVLWHGRWIVAYERHIERRELAQRAVRAVDRYVLAGLQEASRGLREHFRHNHEMARGGPDLRMMVNIHEWMMEPPVEQPQDDLAVELGPSLEAELFRDSGDVQHGTRMGVSLSLLQAHLIRRYGTNWVEGFLQNRVVNYPPGSPHAPRLYRNYPIPKTGTMAEPPVNRSEVPLMAGAKKAPKKRPNSPPGLTILMRDEWADDEPDGTNLPRLRKWGTPRPRSPAQPSSPSSESGEEESEEGEDEGVGEEEERGVKRPAATEAGTGAGARISKVPKEIAAAAQATGAGPSGVEKRREKEVARKVKEGRVDAGETVSATAGPSGEPREASPGASAPVTAEEVAEAEALVTAEAEAAEMREALTEGVDMFAGKSLNELAARYVQLSEDARGKAFGQAMLLQILHLQQVREVELVRERRAEDPITEVLRADRGPPYTPQVLQNATNYRNLNPTQRVTEMGNNLFSAFLQGRAEQLRAFHQQRFAEALAAEAPAPEPLGTTTSPTPTPTPTQAPVPPIAVGQKRKAAKPQEEVRPKKVAETAGVKPKSQPPGTGDKTSSPLTEAAKAKKSPPAPTAPVSAAGGGDRPEQVKTPPSAPQPATSPGASQPAGTEGGRLPLTPTAQARADRDESIRRWMVDCEDDVRGLKRSASKPRPRKILTKPGTRRFPLAWTHSSGGWQSRRTQGRQGRPKPPGPARSSGC